MNESNCSRCNASRDELVLVWESIDMYNRGADPKFIGCTNCNEMDKV